MTRYEIASVSVMPSLGPGSTVSFEHPKEAMFWWAYYRNYLGDQWGVSQGSVYRLREGDPEFRESFH